MGRIPLVIGWQERVRSNLQRNAKLTVRFVWKGVALPNWHTHALLLFLFHHQVDKRLSKKAESIKKTSDSAMVAPKTMLNSLVADAVDDLTSSSSEPTMMLNWSTSVLVDVSTKSAITTSSSDMVLRPGVGTAVLEHTPVVLFVLSKNKPQRHPYQGGIMDEDVRRMQAAVLEGIPLALPEHPGIDSSVDHAPNRRQILTAEEKLLALENALRYIPPQHHESLADEFMDELNTYGRIIMRRYRPTSHPMKAYSLDAYPCVSRQAASIMLMIHNNLDSAVAQFPHELITYGGNGSVFQNWCQYRLVMKYLCEMTDQQTLVMYSGHPLGLFPSGPAAPRVVVTNGMVIPNYSSQDDYERMNALGVTQYGQMTAGSYMYIGPQGIVHGTTITLLNAARLHLGLSDESNLSGITFITSGLGGMSGAQAKAATIAGAACIIAETNAHAAHKRHNQGWLTTVTDDIDDAIDQMVQAANDGNAISIGLIGNIVELWERCVEREVHVDLGSDQTSLHNPYQGGYFPANRTYEESATMLSEDPARFRSEVQSTLRRHAAAINTMAERGMYFWDYGNAFLLEASALVPMSSTKTGHSVIPPTSRTSWARCALTTGLARTVGFARAATLPI